LIRRFAISFAFATLCFLNTWVELAEGETPYYARFDPLHGSLLAVIVLQSLLALGFFAAWQLCRRWKITGSVVLQMAFLASCFFPFGIAAAALMRAMPFDLAAIIRQTWFWPAALVLGTPVMAFAAMRPGPFGGFVRALFLNSCPVLAVVMAQGVRTTLLAFPASAYADAPSAPRLPQPPPSGVRVVWIIFDELSEAITFSHRPAGLSLPEFDRLRRESFHALAARSPAGDTKESLPSLILGEHAVRAEPAGPNSLLLETHSKPAPFEWGSVPNVFDSARALGFNTALAGWFHPYGRLLNRSLTSCTWTAGWLLPGAEEPTVLEPLYAAMMDRLRLQAATLPLVGHIPGFFPGVYHRREKQQRFSYLLEQARSYASDPGIGLVLIHLPAPHPPAVYNRAEGSFASQGRLSYLDGVALADRALGELRKSIERAGLWEQTTVLVSADHGWRTHIWRGGPEWTAEEEAACHGIDTSGVPFLLKVAGAAEDTEYSKPFDTVVTRQLILAILEGRVETAAQVVEFVSNPSPSESKRSAPKRPARVKMSGAPDVMARSPRLRSRSSADGSCSNRGSGPVGRTGG
jgi:hypothetical protein